MRNLIPFSFENNEMYEWMRKAGYLERVGTRNRASDRSIRSGWFVTRVISGPNSTSISPMVTEKGVEFFLDLFRRRKNEIHRMTEDLYPVIFTNEEDEEGERR